jgi:hypothetical protein
MRGDLHCRDCRAQRAQEATARLPQPNVDDPTGETMLVPLTHGKFALIDATDAPLVAQHVWHECPPTHHRTSYAITRVPAGNGKRGVLRMHRLIRPDIDGEIDHIDMNGLNNRRSNLRAATASQNRANMDTYRNNTSGHRGVQLRKSDRWIALIRRDNKTICLGRFDTREEAGRAYDEAAKRLFGEFARTTPSE